jgi:hypothetical protein
MANGDIRRPSRRADQSNQMALEGTSEETRRIVTLASPENPTAQLTIVDSDPALPHPDYSVEVADVDVCYRRAQEQGWDILHPLTVERWGVKRFFVRDPTAGSPMSCNTGTACQRAERSRFQSNRIEPRQARGANRPGARGARSYWPRWRPVSFVRMPDLAFNTPLKPLLRPGAVAM